MTYPDRLRRSRPLTITEKAMAAVTLSLAAATMFLAAAHSAGASEKGGVLLDEGARSYSPATAISHVETSPLD